MDSEFSTTQFHGSIGFDLRQWLCAVATSERARAHAVLSPLHPLHPRPKVSWYESLARQRHRTTGTGPSAATLTGTKDEVARESGFANWRKLVEVIKDRHRRAVQFKHALAGRDESAVLQALEADPAAVVDVALKADVSDLEFCGSLAQRATDRAVATMHLVLFALAKFGDTAGLAERTGAIVLPDFDWQAAKTLLEDRLCKDVSTQRGVIDNHEVDQAIVELCSYDEPEHDCDMNED